MELKYKKFVDNGKGDCIYCNERRHDCCCDENTAKALGYHYEWITITKKKGSAAYARRIECI
ncbi:MAG TPA: hypothetical protein DEA43_04775 [Candidatus Moranbacteria bacterium]|nr:hypothetical protein [Candidatus Moranbacteria bacterium]HBT46168.1 hypothetical protein [Candidatus Moranbacteria bacterium]